MQIQGTPLQEPQPYLENSIPMQEMYIQPNNQLLYAKPQDQNNNFPPPPLQDNMYRPHQPYGMNQPQPYGMNQPQTYGMNQPQPYEVTQP